MRRLSCFIGAVSLIVISATARADTGQLDRLAACAGMIVGNGAVDFIFGDEMAFDDAADIAYSAYFSEALVGGYDQNDLMIADKILSGNVDKVINAYNTDTFDNELYEEIVICYRTLSRQLIDRADVIVANQSQWESLKAVAIKTMKRMLSAG